MIGHSNLGFAVHVARTRHYPGIEIT